MSYIIDHMRVYSVAENMNLLQTLLRMQNRENITLRCSGNSEAEASIVHREL